MIRHFRQIHPTLSSPFPVLEPSLRGIGTCFSFPHPPTQLWESVPTASTEDSLQPWPPTERKAFCVTCHHCEHSQVPSPLLRDSGYATANPAPTRGPHGQQAIQVCSPSQPHTAQPGGSHSQWTHSPAPTSTCILPPSILHAEKRLDRVLQDLSLYPKQIKIS